MSHTERIIGIPGLAVERVVRKQGIEVWARPVTAISVMFLRASGHATDLQKRTSLRYTKHMMAALHCASSLRPIR
jgi:hypothetical protein